MTRKIYTSKLLLFGEHIIITGASALALPFQNYYGLWSDQLEKETLIDIDYSSLDSIKRVFHYIEKLHHQKKLLSLLDLVKFKQDIDAKLWFYSNIPTGYGLGSSGAVCAAIYDRYCISPETDLIKLKAELAQLENCFHGQSSGIDPLVCYLNQMLLIETDKSISVHSSPIRQKNTDTTIFLVDTGVSRQTTDFVNYFLEQATNPLFQKECVRPLSIATNSAILAFREGKSSTLLEQVEIISTLQYQYLQKMILKDFLAIWKQGIDSGLYFLKLCGAGGGGFMLGFTKNWQKTQKALSTQKLKLIYEL